MTHSLLPPSSAARRVACPGSHRLEILYPQQESEAAAEGDLAHELCRILLTQQSKGGGYLYEPGYYTDEMVEGAEKYTSFIRKLNPNLDGLHIEELLDISTIHPMSFGTPDCWWFDAAKGHIHICDYKFGYGFVEVFENWQLIAYAAGILDHLKIAGNQDSFIDVHFHIIQPRSYHPEGVIRTWKMKAVNLRPFFNVLRGTEAEALKDNAPCIPSPECGYCSARHACPALQASTSRIVDIVKQNTPLELDGNALGNELRILKEAYDLLDARISALSEEALSKIRRGERIAHFTAERVAGRERWKSSVGEVIALGELLGVDLSKPLDVITPKQAVKAGIPEDVVRSYSEVGKDGVKLSRINLRKVFSHE